MSTRGVAVLASRVAPASLEHEPETAAIATSGRSVRSSRANASVLFGWLRPICTRRGLVVASSPQGVDVSSTASTTSTPAAAKRRAIASQTRSAPPSATARVVRRSLRIRE